MEPSVVVIGAQAGSTSRGPLAVGEYVRLPIVEALTLTHQQMVTLAPWADQQPAPEPAIKRRRYRRRDMRAEK